VTIVQRVLDDLVAHARAEQPRECCGLLIGTGDHVIDSMRARNLDAGTSRFVIDPPDHFAAIRSARDRSLDVVGYYHSHPRSRAYPSDTDMRESGYAGAMHVIVGCPDSGVEIRAFRIDEDRITELPYVVAHA
jgi:proteasome lid subunit RPN8/RPN11